jgi:hypothetical protein
MLKLVATPKLRLFAGHSIGWLESKHFNVILPSREDSNLAKVER